MNAYTTIEESKQLIEAGLDVNTADMFYVVDGEEIYTNPVNIDKLFCDKNKFPYYMDNDIPAWSLAALLNIIDNNDLVYDISNDKNREFKILVYKADYTNQEVKFHHTEHSIVDMITWLLENNYIKSNKNE
jgi:hypothetical protein